MKIGTIIKKERKEKGLTQKELAKAVGVSQAAIAKYESGENMVSFEMVNKISEALGLHPLGLAMMAAARQQHEALTKHRDNDYHIGEIAKMLNEAYPNDGNDYSFADFSYFDAMNACFNSLCLDSGYIFEVIETSIKGENGMIPSKNYHFFNDSEDYYFSITEIHQLWESMVEHMTIDFKKLLSTRKETSVNE